MQLEQPLPIPFLEVDVLKLVVEEAARWACLLARGGGAVLADVAHHEPAVFPPLPTVSPWG
jgi:hypothetical protein